MKHLSLSVAISAYLVGCSGAYAQEPIKIEAPLSCWETSHVMKVYENDGQYRPLLTIDNDSGSIVVLVKPDTRDAHAWFVLADAGLMCLIDEGKMMRFNVPLSEQLSGKKGTM